MTEVARCQTKGCGVSIEDTHPYSWCSECGEPLPADITANLAVLVGLRAEAAGQQRAREGAPPADAKRQTGIVIGVIGVLLLVFGAIRWNSMGSQLLRAFGQTDGPGILLFLSGAVALAIGFQLVFSSASARPTSPTPVAKSVEERIRELDDLRSKQLITDTEHAQRKKDIIASL